jgi:hypothetical protein
MTEDVDCDCHSELTTLDDKVIHYEYCALIVAELGY